MAINNFHHALKFRKEVCIGCSHCMNVCPTQAIRISNGKAELRENRCVDCGKCYRACPVGAIIVEQDDFSRIFEFDYRIALIPNVLHGQFPSNVSVSQVCSVLLDLGFTDIYEVEHGTSILRNALSRTLEERQDTRPLISTFCPAIVRLIQVRFPSLTDNLILLKAPLDITAAYCRRKLAAEGVPAKEIGIFYITPCAAKIAAVKSPVGESQSIIDGVINMDFIFNKVYTSVKQGFSGQKACRLPALKPLLPYQMLWSLTEGESSVMPGRALAIDEIGNVTEFLEKMENEDVSDIDFLELRACDQSCAGGILTSGNRFLAVERLKKRAQMAKDSKLSGIHCTDRIFDELNGELSTGSIHPRSMDKLDENIQRAMHKMKQVREIMRLLPSVDCGMCGSPTCSALAEDIVQERADISQCVFIQRQYEERGLMSSYQSMGIMKRIWGSDKFSQPQSKN